MQTKLLGLLLAGGRVGVGGGTALKRVFIKMQEVQWENPSSKTTLEVK